VRIVNNPPGATMNKFFFFISILFLLAVSPVSEASNISVQVSGGIEKIPSVTEHNLGYFSMSHLAELLGEGLSWDEPGISVVYHTEQHKATFFINSPYINIDDTVKNLIYPVKIIEGNLYLPARTFIPLLDAIRPEQITWDRDAETIRINSEWYDITDVALTSKANGKLIEIFVTSPKNYEIFLSEGNWLNVTIPNARVNQRQILRRKQGSFLRDINVYQFESSAQISFRFKENIGKYTDRMQTNPPRIQISIPDTTVVPTPFVGPEFIGPSERISKVIIDPGHGGADYGAIGLNKTQEKKIVLDIAKRLAKLIRKDKLFEVVMTREKDNAVSLEDRANLANNENGDIYISIHANASPKHFARGFQVFFLAPANNDEARAAAQLENAPFLAERNSLSSDSIDNLSYILSDMIQTEFQVESADLASMVDKEFRKRFTRKTKARGIDQAGFVVLNRVYMPSILVETAFLTNKDDEKLLRSKEYRQDVAEAIYAGLKRFKTKYEKK
jgi:N-acetylmuramoyl-L-alanine amidase